MTELESMMQYGGLGRAWQNSFRRFSNELGPSTNMQSLAELNATRLMCLRGIFCRTLGCGEFPDDMYDSLEDAGRYDPESGQMLRRNASEVV
jgi:hypothetical protein